MSDTITLSHISEQKPTMVDLGNKAITDRRAVAEGHVKLPAPVGEILQATNFSTLKGPVFNTAIIAGTMAAKNTANLIPLCHPLMLRSIKLRIEQRSIENIFISCEVKALGPTGVEMEALTAVSVAALTIYDMCKALSTEIVIGPILLVEKKGGKRDFKREN